jgi:hypothetical protein
MWERLKTFFGGALGHSAIFALKQGLIPDFVLNWLISKLKESATICGVDLADVNILSAKQAGRMFNISATIENIDPQKLIPPVFALVLEEYVAEVDMPGLLSALEPHSDNILNALLPALPGIVTALKRYIQNDSARHGVVLSGLKVRV